MGTYGVSATQHLFVYGSLRRGFGHALGAALRSESSTLGAGTFQGRLFRVSWFPGAVDSDDPLDVVHGEVYRLALRAPARDGLLTELDEYEGCGTGETAGLFERTERPVRLAASGISLVAWIYLFAGAVEDLPRVDSGDFLARD